MTLAYGRRASFGGRLLGAVQWLPALTAVAYIATAAAMGPQIVRVLGWDTDVSGPLVLAERLRGSGTVYLAHFSAWTLMWWELATRDLPGHVQLWQATGYVFAVAGAVLVGWATARVSTRWAGVTAFAIAVVVGPLALRSLFSAIFHTSNPFTACVLGAFLVLLEQPRARLLAVPVGILAGLNAASDPLLIPAAIVPFALAGAVLVLATHRLETAIRTALVLVLTVASGLSANALMHRLGYHVAGAHSHLSPAHDLPGHVLLFGRMAALVGGANYAIPGAYPNDPLRVVVALLVLFAVAAPVVAAATFVIRRADPLARAYACYWAAATTILGVTFVATTNAGELGPGSRNYLLTLVPAAAAGVALISSSSARARLLAATGVAVVGATNMAGVVDGRAGTPLGAIGTYERPLVRLLVGKHVIRGYAGYWDAQSLTWQSGMRVFVAPVGLCGLPNQALCAFRSSVIASWYRERSGPSFLIVDPTTAFLTAPPPIVRDATASYHFGPLSVYIFPYDLARHIRLQE